MRISEMIEFDVLGVKEVEHYVGDDGKIRYNLVPSNSEPPEHVFFVLIDLDEKIYIDSGYSDNGQIRIGNYMVRNAEYESVKNEIIRCVEDNGYTMAVNKTFDRSNGDFTKEFMKFERK